MGMEGGEGKEREGQESGGDRRRGQGKGWEVPLALLISTRM